MGDPQGERGVEEEEEAVAAGGLSVRRDRRDEKRMHKRTENELSRRNLSSCLLLSLLLYYPKFTLEM